MKIIIHFGQDFIKEKFSIKQTIENMQGLIDLGLIESL